MLVSTETFFNRFVYTHTHRICRLSFSTLIIITIIIIITIRRQKEEEERKLKENTH